LPNPTHTKLGLKGVDPQLPFSHRVHELTGQLEGARGSVEVTAIIITPNPRFDSPFSTF
jgi:hypothetical protein